MKNIFVSDSTLKVIEELDSNYSFREKLNISNCLDELNLNAIELPEVVNSKEKEILVKTIATSVKNADIKICAGKKEEDISASWECVKNTNNPTLQIIMPISTAQMEYFYHLKAPAMQNRIIELIKYAKTYTDNVEFVAKDAFRAEKGFLISLAQAVYEAGAKSITLYDDADVALPKDYAIAIKEIKSLCDIKVYVSPSNNLSLATAVVIECIEADVDGIVTSSKGNALSVEVLTQLLRAKGNDLGVSARVDVTKAKTLCAKICNIQKESPKKDIEETDLNDLSDGASMQEVVALIKELGYDLTDEDNGKVYEEYRRISNKKSVIGVKELEAVIATTAMQVPSTYHLVNYVVNSSNVVMATANVTLEKNGEKFTGVSTGDGPIDAAFHAIEQVVGHHYELDDFQVQAVTKGREAVGSSIIRLRANGKLYSGNGVSTDIIGACIRAFINALNKIVYGEK